MIRGWQADCQCNLFTAQVKVPRVLPMLLCVDRSRRFQGVLGWTHLARGHLCPMVQTCREAAHEHQTDRLHG